MSDSAGKQQVLEEIKAVFDLLHTRLGHMHFAAGSTVDLYIRSARRECSMARENTARAIEELNTPIEVSYRIVR